MTKFIIKQIKYKYWYGMKNIIYKNLETYNFQLIFYHLKQTNFPYAINK